jgi:hypothetical protein
LLKAIIADTRNKIQIVQGNAGIGKTSFLLYVLACLRSSGDKNVLLHFHRDEKQPAVAVLFPRGAGKPAIIWSDKPRYRACFSEWYIQIN